MPNKSEPRHTFMPEPILEAIQIDCKESYHVMARGLSKTSNLQAYKLKRNLTDMPRSAWGLVGETYQQLLTRILPALIAGWERLGWRKDVHYFIGRYAPAKWGWDIPYEPPVRPDYFIHTCFGSGVHLVSQDRPGTSNGLNLDGIHGDEAKYLDYEKFTEELLPTMRANRQRFGHLHHHKSITFTTSMPDIASGKWIFEKEKLMQGERIEMIRILIKDINELQLRKLQAEARDLEPINRRISRITSQLNALQRGDDMEPAVFYSEASSIDNLEVLGEDYILQMYRNMPKFIFDTEILNIRPDQVENGFYPLLEVSKHTYSGAFNYGYLDKKDYDMEALDMEALDCAQQKDINPNDPIHIAVDWGARISCLVAGQRYGRDFNYVKDIYVMHPKLIGDLADEYAKYFKPHKNRHIYYYYYRSENPRTPIHRHTYAEQFIKALQAHGFIVIKQEMAQPHPYHERYLLWHRLLSQDPDMPRVNFNRNECRDLINSMLLAPARQGSKGIEKDKTSERRGGDQVEATHFSDAGDTIISALFDQVITGSDGYLPMSS
jgi:hypothetical protein